MLVHNNKLNKNLLSKTGEVNINGLYIYYYHFNRHCYYVSYYFQKKINFHTKHIGTKQNVNLNILVAKNRALIIRLQENLAYVQKTSEEKNIMNL